MQISEWMIGVGIALLGGYTAWMTRISVGLSRIERMQEDLHSVWNRLDQHGEKINRHTVQLARLDPRTGDAS